jgi:hypothetical protein
MHNFLRHASAGSTEKRANGYLGMQAMRALDDIDWTKTSETEQLAAVRRAKPDELSSLLRSYSWDMFPESVLGWATAQKGVELGAAMAAFFNADPMRFNYVPRRDVPAAHRGTCRLLDAICQRVNAGFYLPNTMRCPERIAKLEHWLYYQSEDNWERRRGRWVFEHDIIDPLLERSKPDYEPVVTEALAEPGFSLRGFLRPLVS